MKRSLKKLAGMGLAFGLMCLSTTSLLHAEDQVGRNQRVLVVLSELDSTGAPELEPLYHALEDLTEHFIGALLQDKYRSIYTLKDRSATLANFKRTVYEQANRSEILAIDVIMSVHGAPNAFALSDGLHTKDEFRDEMLATSNRREQINKIFVKKKLRALYNLACYGGKHMEIMRDIGFSVVNGAKGVNANSELELVPALTAWGNGVGFRDSFVASNNPISLAISDVALREVGKHANNMLKDIDSEKVFSGFVNKTINSPATE
jgi:hypothetical protein